MPSRAPSTKEIAVADASSHSPRPRPIGIVVAGMHRSGTSALTRAINLLGADLPKDLLGASVNNPLGHWEPRKVYEIQQELFARMDSAWDVWEPLSPDWFASSAAERVAHDIADFLIADFAQSDLFVVKEPRICRFLPVWKRAFEIANMDLRIVMPIRRPTEVARSLAKRNGMPEMRGLFIWLRYILDAEAGSRGLKRTTLLYEDLLTDWPRVLRKLGDDLGVAWPRWTRQSTAEVSGFLSPEHRHQVDVSTDLSTRIDLPAWIGQAWGAIVPDGDSDGPDQSTLDAVNLAFSEAADPFARLVAAELDGAKTIADQQRHTSKGERAALARQVEELEAARAAAVERGDRFKAKWRSDQTLMEAGGAERLRLADELQAAEARCKAALDALDAAKAEAADAEARVEDLNVAARLAESRARDAETKGIADTEAAVADLARSLGEARAAIVLLTSERDQLMAELEARTRAA